MQPVESQVPHGLLAQLLYGLALLVTGGVVKELVDWFRNRKKQRAEVVEISAQTVKVHAEARQLDTRTIIEATERIEELSDKNVGLHVRLADETKRADKAEFEVGQAKIEMRLMEEQIKKLNGVLHARGIRLSDFDEPKA